MSSLAAVRADGYYKPEEKAMRNRLSKKKKARREDGAIIVSHPILNHPPVHIGDPHWQSP